MMTLKGSELPSVALVVLLSNLPGKVIMSREDTKGLWIS